MEVMQIKLDQELMLILNSTDDDGLEMFTLSKKLYRSCINEGEHRFAVIRSKALHFFAFPEAILSRGIEPLKKIIEDLGGWPVLNGNMTDDIKFSVLEIIKKGIKVGININFPLTVIAVPNDHENATQKILAVRKLA